MIKVPLSIEITVIFINLNKTISYSYQLVVFNAKDDHEIFIPRQNTPCTIRAPYTSKGSCSRITLSMYYHYYFRRNRPKSFSYFIQAVSQVFLWKKHSLIV